jgi:transcriptional regulator with XRE-family HTH domain
VEDQEPSCGHLQLIAGGLATLAGGPIEERRRRRFNRQFELLEGRQIVEIVRGDLAAGEAVNAFHETGRRDALVGMPALELPTKNGRAVSTELVRQLAPAKLRTLAPRPQFHQHPQRLPLWLSSSLPIWQYANLEMSGISYLRRVANDRAPPNRIRELREAAQLTQVELAKRANVTPSALNKVEMGRRGLDQQWMERIAAALDCAPADLLPDSQNPDRPKGAEHALLQMYRNADETQRRQILALVQALLSPEDVERMVEQAA